MIKLSLFILLSFIGCKSDKNEKVEEQDPASTFSDSVPDLHQSITRGKEIYNDFCASCHLPSGKGTPGTVPPLDGADWLTEKRMESIRAVKFGLQGPIEVNGEEYNNYMTPLGLSDAEVADVMNYILNSWSNTIEPPVTEEEVAAVE